jgi:hypothetical protein
MEETDAVEVRPHLHASPLYYYICSFYCSFKNYFSRAGEIELKIARIQEADKRIKKK